MLNLSSFHYFGGSAAGMWDAPDFYREIDCAVAVSFEERNCLRVEPIKSVFR